MSEGEFGRIPPQTSHLFQQLVADLRSQVMQVLPPGAGDEVRAVTVELLLQAVLRDWRENNNTSGLLPQDIEDLKSFVSLAVSQAGNDLNGSGLPVYRTVLEALLADWEDNWNADGVSGPPKRD